MKNHQFLMPLIVPLILAATLAGCGGSSNKSYPSDPPVRANTAPVATEASFTTQADTPLSDMLAGMDADQDALVFAVAAQPTQGTLMLAADGSFTYQPNATVTGMDQFTFTVADGRAVSMTATVDITIEALQVSFNDYSRAALAQLPSDEPLPINGREFNQDVTDPSAYDDLFE